MTEEWRDIPGYPGYQVSDQGRVRSLDRVIAHPRGGQHSRKGKVLKPWIDHWGYPKIALGTMVRGFVHRFVLLAFVGPAPDGHQAHHCDHDKQNNCIENLLWVTPSDNTCYAYEAGIKTAPTFKGEKHPQSKLTREEVVDIRKLVAGGHTKSSVARKFGVHNTHVGKIVRRERWGHVE